jgi:hypothetical protein
VYCTECRRSLRCRPSTAVQLLGSEYPSLSMQPPSWVLYAPLPLPTCSRLSTVVVRGIHYPCCTGRCTCTCPPVPYLVPLPYWTLYTPLACPPVTVSTLTVWGVVHASPLPTCYTSYRCCTGRCVRSCPSPHVIAQYCRRRGPTPPTHVGCFQRTALFCTVLSSGFCTVTCTSRLHVGGWVACDG